MKKEIRTGKAPTPIGTYSQGVEFKDIIFISGQIPLDKKGQRVEGSIEEKVTAVMENISHILQEAGSDFNRVLYCQIFLKSIENFSKVNEVYKKYFNKPYPARAVIGGVELPGGADIEITVVAHR